MRALEWCRSQTLKGGEEKNSFEEGLGGLCPCAHGYSDSGAVWTGAMAPGCAILCSLHRIYGDKVCVEWKSVYFLCVQYLRCKTNARSQGLSRMKTNVLAQHSKSPTSKSSFHKKKNHSEKETYTYRPIILQVKPTLCSNPLGLFGTNRLPQSHHTATVDTLLYK